MAASGIVEAVHENLNTASYRYIAYTNLAVFGNKISDVVSRASTTDTYKKTITGVPVKNVEIIWIGANETETNGTTNYNSLASYLLTQSAKGWHFIVCTMTPKTTSVLPAWRDEYNNHLRANTAGITNYHVVDTDLIPALCDPTDTTYFDGDKLHLNATGKVIAGNAIAEVLKTL